MATAADGTHPTRMHSCLHMHETAKVSAEGHNHPPEGAILPPEHNGILFTPKRKFIVTPPLHSGFLVKGTSLTQNF